VYCLQDFRQETEGKRSLGILTSMCFDNIKVDLRDWVAVAFGGCGMDPFPFFCV
jgi:hypothetical protein